MAGTARAVVSPGSRFSLDLPNNGERTDHRSAESHTLVTRALSTVPLSTRNGYAGRLLFTPGEIDPRQIQAMSSKC